jgi:hypothetical protein
VGIIAFCVFEGTWRNLLHALFVYGPTMAAESGRYSGWELPYRFLMGNPEVAWWGKGTWPLLVIAVLGATSAMFSARRAHTLLFVAWTATSYAEVYLPGLFWQHYYLLAVPSLSLLAATGMAELLSRAGEESRAPARGVRAARWIQLLLCLALVALLGGLQYIHFLALSPDEIAIKHKAGREWVALRALGRIIAQAAAPNERLFVWGWQSPLHIYSRLDSVTPYVFYDPMMQKYRGGEHPLVEPQKRRLAEAIRTEKPAIVYLGDAPFSELQEILQAEYRPVFLRPLPAERPMVLHVRRDVVDRFRAALTREIEPR